MVLVLVFWIDIYGFGTKVLNRHLWFWYKFFIDIYGFDDKVFFIDIYGFGIKSLNQTSCVLMLSVVMLSAPAPSITAHRMIGIIATFSINDTHHDVLLRVTLYYYVECRYPWYCNTDTWHNNTQHCNNGVVMLSVVASSTDYTIPILPSIGNRR